MIQQVFLHRVPVEPGDGAQPPGDGGPGAGLQIAGEALDVRAAGLEQAQVVLVAPATMTHLTVRPERMTTQRHMALPNRSSPLTA